LDAGIGAKFRRWNTSTGVWVDLAEITNINPSAMTRDVHESTALDTTGGYRTFISSKLRDPGSITLTMNFDRTSYDTLQSDFESDTIQNYEIVLVDADKTSWEFTGLVTELPIPTVAFDAPITLDVTIKITGAPSTESGSGS
jgi:predicted secreted protein